MSPGWSMVRAGRGAEQGEPEVVRLSPHADRWTARRIGYSSLASRRTREKRGFLPAQAFAMTFRTKTGQFLGVWRTI